MEKILQSVIQRIWRFRPATGGWVNRTGLQGFGAGFSRFPQFFTFLVIFLLKNGVAMAAGSPECVAGLEISKSVDKSVATTGEEFTYTIHYRAASLNQNFTAVKITDLLPSSVEFVAAYGSQHTTSFAYSPGTHTVTFNFIDPLLAGSTGEVKIIVKFPAGTTPDGTVATNSATISASNSGTVTSNTVVTTAEATVPPQVSKWASGGGGLDGPTTFSIYAANPYWNGGAVWGSVDLSSVTIVDNLPVGAVFVSADNGGTYNSTTHKVTWNVGSIASGYDWQAHVTLKFPSGTFSAGQWVENTGTMTYTPLGQSAQTLPISGWVQLKAANSYSASLDKSGSEESTEGTNAFFYLTYNNTSTGSLDNVYIEDVIPSGAMVYGFSSGSWLYGGSTSPAVVVKIRYFTNLNSVGTLVTAPDLDDHEYYPTLAPFEYITKIRWELGSVPEGFQSPDWGCWTCGMKVFWNPKSGTSGTSINNCASAYSTTSGYVAATDCHSTTVLQDAPFLNPTKDYTNSPDPFLPGDVAHFQLFLYNTWQASEPLNDPVVYDLLPNGVTYEPGTIFFSGAWGSFATTTVTPNWNGTGRDMIKVTFSQPIAVNETVTVYYDAKIGQMEGSFVNEYAFTGSNDIGYINTSG